MKEKREGVTQIKLVIIIAVVAVIAGVMISVLSNLVNNTIESAKEKKEQAERQQQAEQAAREQELKQAELQQKAEDIMAKLENADWLSWEDIEVAVAEGLANVSTGASESQIITALEPAIKKYVDSFGSGNTSVTEEQIKYIIENSLSGRLTSVQIEAIVKKYQSAPTISLSISQIAQIKEAAIANALTAAQVKEIVEKVGDRTHADVKTAIDAIVSTGEFSTLTAEQISSIVNISMEKFYP